MAGCAACKGDMLKVDGCGKVPVDTKDGKRHAPIKYGNEVYPDGWKPEVDQRCHDCNCKQQHYHHPGCDVERCPACSGQLISCGCLAEL